MTVLLLAAALLAQTDPRIDGIERLVGDANRPYLWAPLAVTVKSDSGFDGDLEARSSLGLRVVRRIRIPAKGSQRILLPALDPKNIVAGATTVEIPRAARSPDVLVLVDARLPFATELVSDERVLVQRIDLRDLEPLLADGLLEACDLLLLKETAGLSLGGVRSWSVVTTRAEAEKAMAAPPRRTEPLKLVDLEVWNLAPEGGWVPAKRDRTLLFATLYALGSFAALVFAVRKGSRWTAGAIGGVSLLGIGVFLLAFPRGHLWISEASCEVVPAEGDAAELRVWFAGAAASLRPVVDFPRIVKPVYPRLADAEEPLTLRIEERRSRAEGFALGPGRRVGFASVSGRAPAMRVKDRASLPLLEAFVRRGGRITRLGDVAAGGSVVDGGREGDLPGEYAGRPWLRFLEGDGVFGWRDHGGRPAGDVGSPDLADGRCGPSFFIQRFP